MKFEVEIPDELFEDMKEYLEEDIGADYSVTGDTEVFQDILKEGTLSMIISDMDRLKEITVVNLSVPVEQTEPAPFDITDGDPAPEKEEVKDED